MQYHLSNDHQPWCDVPDSVRQVVTDGALWDWESPLVIAVSGGLDSMALLHCLHQITVNPQSKLIAAHFNHATRPESDLAETTVGDFCRSLGIAYNTGRLRDTCPAGQSREAFWRSRRYDFLEEVRAASHAAAIATAHTLDDQFETILMRLITGCGPRGLLGIHPRHPHIIRPFLAIRREDIVRYVRKYNLPVVEDPSNQNTSHPRNYLRHHVVPLLKTLNPRCDRAAASLVEILRSEDEWFTRAARSELTRIGWRNQTPWIFPRSAFKGAERAMLRRMAAELIRVCAVPETDRTTRAVIDNTAQWLGGTVRRLTITDRLFGRHTGGWKCLFRKADIRELPGDTVELPVPGNIQFGQYRIRSELFAGRVPVPDDHNYMELSTEHTSLYIQGSLPGNQECVVYPDRTMTLKDFFRSHGIPAELRSSLPLVMDDQSRILGFLGPQKSFSADTLNTGTQRLVISWITT